MTFRDLNLPLSLSTTELDPLKTFFEPVLSVARTYDVAVGYFSTLWIRDAAAGLAPFACNGGHARWVVSPHLSEEDLKAIADAASPEEQASRIDRVVRHSIDELLRQLQEEPRATLSWLVRDGVMAFRVAIPRNALRGIFHPKMGVFADAHGNEVGFSGSYNLTGSAATNWEDLHIFCGWRSREAQDRINLIKQRFERIWCSRDPNLAVHQPGDQALEPFIRITRVTDRPYERPDGSVDGRTADTRALPRDTLQLRTYQENAIAKWFGNNGRGVLSMATGTGKTVTALAAASRLCRHAVDRRTRLVVVVAVPFRHLADQWAEEAATFGFAPIVCYDQASTWMADAQAALAGLYARETGFVLLVAVNNTLANGPFQGLLRGLRDNLLLIADEMHNLGAPRLLRSLPENATFRLGLSATPDRHGDEQGTKALAQYFGPPVLEFGLREAIEHGFLCQYRYYPVVVPLTGDEMSAYKELSARIARAYASDGAGDDGPSDRLKKLLIERARLIGKAENKTTMLLPLLDARSDSQFNLVYCSDASDGDERQVDRVLRLIGTRLGMRANRFTAEETPAQRQELLRDFASGRLQTLVAIRCLDEGVDVPRTETAYILASSTNPRQFIQRRGRVLRKAPGKHTATIFDFIAVPDLEELSLGDPAAFNIERNLVRRELSRVNEFADLALNRGEAMVRLRDLRKKLNLLDT